MAGDGAGGGAVGKHVHRRAARVPAGNGVGVDGDEHIGLHTPRLGKTIAQTDVIIAGANQDRLHVGLAPHQLREFPGDGQRHVLFTRAVASADGAGIFTAMPGIDGNHEGTLVTCRWRYRRSGGFFSHAGVEQIDHQPMTIGSGRFEQKTLGLDIGLQCQHHAQIVSITGDRHARVACAVRIERHTLGLVGLIDIHLQTRRITQQLRAMLDRTGEIEDQPGVVRRLPLADLVNRDRRRRRHGGHPSDQENEKGARLPSHLAASTRAWALSCRTFIRTRRCPSWISMIIAMSASGKSAPARSGHSTRQTLPPPR